MGDLSFGIAFGQAPRGMPTVQELIAFGENAEALGLDSIWMGDHIVMHAPMLDPISVLAAMAVRTKRIKLGTGVLLVPLRPPATIAKSIATVDYLSEGRVIFGVGVGGENPKEFQLCGVPVNERGARTNEGIRIIRRLWSEGEVTHEGRFWQFEGVTMEPKPVQPGGPPIWVGGRSEAALRRAATLCDGYMGYMFTPERFKESMDRIRTVAAEAGRDISHFVPSIHLFTSLANSREEGRRLSADYLTNIYNQPFESLVDRYCLFGTPEQCAERIVEYVRAGAQHVVLRPTAGATDMLRYVEVTALQLVPQVRALLP